VDADSAGSKATAQAEGVKGYPTIKFYAAGSSSGEVYQGGRTEADLVKFLNSKAGTHRTVGGGLDGLAGTVGALDSIIKKYKSGGSVADLAKEAANVVTSASDAAQKQYGSYYLRVLEKIKQTPEFAQKELARLEKLLEDRSLALVKKDELTLRANVLRKFVKVTGGDRAKDEL
jgi:protein disulfide-isomerase A6